MPAPALAADPLVSALTAAQRRIELEQARILTEPLAGHRRRILDRLARNVAAEMAALRDNAGRFLATRLPEIYSSAGEATGLGFAWNAAHRQAVAAIADNAYTEILAATRYMDDDTKRWIRETTRNFNLSGHIESYTPQQLAGRMADLGPKAATVAGMPLPIHAVTYRDGSVRTIEDYTDMLMRTTNQAANNAGSVRTAMSVGILRFEGADGAGCGLWGHGPGGGPEAHGLIVTAEQALEFPIAHPNCQRTWIPRPDLDPPRDADAETIGRDVGAFDSTVTAEARADDLEARAERAARLGGRTTPRPRGQAAARARLDEAQAARINGDRVPGARPARTPRPTTRAPRPTARQARAAEARLAQAQADAAAEAAELAAAEAARAERIAFARSLEDF